MAFVLIVYRLFPLAFHAAWWLTRAAQFTTSIGVRAAGEKANVVEIDKLWCWASFVQFAFNCLICLKILLSGGEGKKIKERKSHLSTWNEMHINIMRMHAMHLLCSQQPLHASIRKATRLSSLGLLSSINFHSRSGWTENSFVSGEMLFNKMWTCSERLRGGIWISS